MNKTISKACLLSALFALCIPSLAHASIDDSFRLGVGVRSTGGPAWSAAGIGGGSIGVYLPNSDFEIGYSSYSDNATLKSSLSELSLTGKYKQRIGKNDNFVLGVTYMILGGQITNVNLSSGTLLGVFTGVQHYLGDDFVAEFQFYPYANQSVQFSGFTTTQSTYLGAWTLGMTYLIPR